MTNRLWLLFLLLYPLIFTSCSEPPDFDPNAAHRWSKSNVVNFRQSPALYFYTRRNGKSVGISTAEMQEKETGLVFNDGEILFNGFYVYPGKVFAKEIDEAIQLAMTMEGADYSGEE
jgi:hypothetical protein